MRIDDEMKELQEALERFKGGAATFGLGHVTFAETEDWPHIDLNCRDAANKTVANPLARYISAACNAAPALLREIERLRGENERERASRQQAQREVEQAQEDRNRARMRGEVDARRTLQPVIDRAVAREREACAVLCEQWGDARKPDCGGNALRNVAAAIREGQQPAAATAAQPKEWGGTCASCGAYLYGIGGNADATGNCKACGEPAAATAAQPDINTELLEALEEARNGLAWYQDRFPEATDGSDDEAMARIDAAIAKAAGATAAQPRKPASNDDWRVDAVEAELLDSLDDPNGSEREWAQAIVGRIDGWEAEGNGGEAAATGAQPQPQDALDAARYRWLRGRTSGERGGAGFQRFALVLPKPVSNVMQGAVCQHLDDAIDAAMVGPAAGATVASQ